MKQHLIVANWKMYMPFNKALTLVQEHKAFLTSLQQSSNQLVICPSFPLIYPLAQQLHNTPVSIGAQACSAHKEGAYTGQVDATTLAQAGARYCLVGHQEWRAYHNYTTQDLAAQVKCLLNASIKPIMCIGEQVPIASIKDLDLMFEQELATILPEFDHAHVKECIIAYEPAWAIATGQQPSLDRLAQISNYLADKATSYGLSPLILYGGSVTEMSAADILAVDTIHGLLVGSASIDFQRLQKIVS